MALIDMRNIGQAGDDPVWLDTLAGSRFEGRYRQAERAGRERAEHRWNAPKPQAVDTPKLGGGPRLLDPAPENPLTEESVAHRRRLRREREAAHAELHEDSSLSPHSWR